MLNQALLTRPVVIVRRTDSGEIDDYGTPIPTVERVETVCEFQRRARWTSEEQADAGEVSDTLWEVVLPAGTVIGTADSVEVDGQAFEVVGDPWHVRSPRTGSESHVELTVRRVAGAGDP